MTQTIEQLQAKVAELEEENTALVKTIQRDTLTSLRQLAAKDEVIAEAGEMLAMRDRQLAALNTELREICAAIDDPAGDLTLTAVECIKKLKAESEALRRDADGADKTELGPQQ